MLGFRKAAKKAPKVLQDNHFVQLKDISIRPSTKGSSGHAFV